MKKYKKGDHEHAVITSFIEETCLKQVNGLLSQPCVKALVQLIRIVCPELKVILQSILKVSWRCWHMVGHVDAWISMVTANQRHG